MLTTHHQYINGSPEQKEALEVSVLFSDTTTVSLTPNSIRAWK
jgi:hypothetical protein